ncbi:MAG: ATP-binding protein [Actinomycetota bacterium]
MTAAGAVDERDDADLQLTFPPRPEFVSTARHTVAALARLHEVADEVVEDIKLAVSEACTNAVTANARAGEGDPVRLIASVGGDEMVIEVLDVAGIDPELLERDTEFDSKDFSFEHGLSLPLLRGLVDDLDIEPHAGRGATLRMRVSLAAGVQSP